MPLNRRKTIAELSITADKFELDFFKFDFRADKVAFGGRLGYVDSEGNFVTIREVTRVLRGDEMGPFFSRVETHLEKLVSRAINALTEGGSD